jgi:hypothetical protein
MAIKIGNNNIAKIFKGTVEVKEVYKGEDQVFVSATLAPTLAFVSKTQSTVTLTVTNNDPDPLTDIEIRYASSTFTQSSLSITTSQNFTITGLTTNTEFNFIAIADANGKGFSEDSNTIIQTTLAVQEPDIIFVDSNQTRIRIKLQNNNAEECTIVRNFGTTCQTLTTSSTPITVGAGLESDIITLGNDDLTPGTTYCIRAAAVINGILGPVEQDDTRSTVANQTPTISFVSATLSALNFTFRNNNAVPANIRTTIAAGSTATNVTGNSTISVSNLAANTTSGTIGFTGLSQGSTHTIGARAEIAGNLSGQADSTQTTLQITYAISLSPTSINEGASTTATVTTTNFGSGTLY